MLNNFVFADSTHNITTYETMSFLDLVKAFDYHICMSVSLYWCFLFCVYFLQPGGL